MAFRYFSKMSKADLEAKLAELEAELADGKTVISHGAGNINAAQQVQISIIRRIGMVKHDLNILDPTGYPAEDMTLPNRTRATIKQS